MAAQVDGVLSHSQFGGHRVWAAADLGVWESLDGGATWSVLGVGLPNALVADLLFNPAYRLLRAGLRNRGRGCWKPAAPGPR